MHFILFENIKSLNVYIGWTSRVKFLFYVDANVVKFFLYLLSLKDGLLPNFSHLKILFKIRKSYSLLMLKIKQK